MNMNQNLDCQQVCTFLYAYLDNELDSKTALLIEEHLERCPECAGKFDQVQRVREEIRHHVLQLRAPERLKEDIRRLCQERERNYRPLLYVLAASLLLVMGGLVTTLFRGGEMSAQTIGAAVVSASVGQPVHLEGEIVCLRCMMNHQHRGLRPCSEVGHAYALRTDSGEIWVLLPSKTLDSLMDQESDPLSRHATIDGLVASTARPIVDVASLSF